MITRDRVLVFLATIILVDSVMANPTGGAVTSGDVVITQTANQTQIQQNSQKAIINWHTFNIWAGEKTHFQQPQGGIALNRINPTQGPSQIYGQLTATGKIILVNQSGIFFAPGSYVNVGGIIASTSGISDSNFLAGKYVFDQPSLYNGSVINKGTIIAADNGLVALVGTGVSNEGVIQASTGNVVLASGNKFTVDLYGDQLINFAVDEETSNAGVDGNGNKLKNGVNNSGTIMADGGTIQMTAKTASSVVDHVINMDGVVQANTVSQRNGVIILGSGNEDSVHVAGKVYASGKQTGQKGGKVTILAKKVTVESPTEIDVSGDIGGGEILIGGNYQGKGPELNALTTYIAPDVNIHADALTNGNGGKIIAWADEDTYVFGNITARGGSQSGNGGFLETSGHYLDIGNIKVNLSAANGVSGDWLLDPYNITISSGTQSSGFDGGSPTNTFNPTADSIINTTTLQTNLNAANVIISTGLAGSAGGSAGNITISSPILSWSTTNYLHLQALGTIAINAAVATGIAGSKIIFDAGGNVTQSAIISGAGDIEKRGAGTATFSQANTYTGATIIKEGIISIASLADVGNNSPLGTGAGGIIITGGNADGSVLGGTLQYTGGTATVNRPITIGSTDYALGSNGTLKFTGAGTLTWNGAIGHTVSTTDTFIIDTTNTLNSGASGIISNASGTLNLIKKGAGTWGGLILHSYSGTTTINAGAIAASANFNKGTNSVVGSASAVPNGTPSLIFNGGTITTANAVTSFGTDRDILLNSGGGTFNFSAYPTVATITLSGVISGPGQFTKLGPRGTIILTGANTYTGGTLVGASGTIIAGNNSAFGTNAVTVNATSIVQINNGITISNAMNLNGSGYDDAGALRGAGTSTYSGVITLLSASSIGANSGATFNITNASAITGGGFGLTFTGAGNGSLNSVIDTTVSSVTMSGTGTWTLSGNNTYTSGTSITAGTLAAGHNNAFGTNAVVVTAGAAAQINDGITLPNAMTLNGAGVGNTGALVGVGSSALNGLITLGSASTIGSNLGTLSINNVGIITGSAFGLTLTGTGNGVMGSIIGTDSGTLTKSGSGTWTLTNSGSNYTSGTYITGGKLTASSLSPSGSASSIGTGDIFISGGGTFAYSGGTVSGINRLITIGTGGGTLQTSNTSATTLGLTGGISLGTNALTMNVGGNSASVVNISGTAITGSGSIVKSGIGTLALAVANPSYTGNINITAGTLALTGSGALSNNTVINNSVFDISNTTSGGVIGSMSGAGNVLLGSQTLTINAGSGDNFSGVISGLGGFTMGGGTITLSGANTYTGVTTINAGTLALSGSGKISNNALINNGVFDISAAASGISILTLSGSGNMLLGANTLTLTNASGTYAGVISGTGGFTLVGGNEIFSNTNTYSGNTLINAGSLAILDGQSLPNSDITNNGTFYVPQGSSVSVHSISGSGSIDITGSTLQVTNASGLISGPIISPFDSLNPSQLAIIGGEQSITGDQTSFSGDLYINNGATLKFSTGAPNLRARLIVDGTLLVETTPSLIGTLRGSGNVILNSPLGLLGSSASSPVNPDTFAGVISGASGISIFGLQAFSGVNTYTGVTDIQTNGWLMLKGDGSIANSSAVVFSGGASSQFDISGINSSEAFIRNIYNSDDGYIYINDKTLTFTNAAGGFGGLITNNFGPNTGSIKLLSGNLALTNSGSDYTGGTYIQGGTLTASYLSAGGGASSVGAGNITITNGGTLAYAGTGVSTDRVITIGAGGGTLQTTDQDVTNPSYIVFTGGINVGSNPITFDVGDNTNISIETLPITGSGLITKNGLGGLAIHTDNPNYTGNVNINDGTIYMYAGSTLPNSDITNNVNGTFSTINDTGSESDYTNPMVIHSISSAGIMSISGQLQITNASGTISGKLLGVNDAVYPNRISIMGGEQTITGNNDYTGDLYVNNGAILKYTGTKAALNGSVIVDGTMVVDNNLEFAQVGSLSGVGSVTLNSSLSITNETPYMQANGSHYANFSGVISGTGGLFLLAHQQLSNVNTYTGSTVISSGAGIILTGNGSISNSSKISLTSSSSSFVIKDIFASETSIQSLAGTVPSSTVTLGAKTLTITNASDSYAGIITDGVTPNGSIKLLAGNLTLTGSASTYTGGTYIQGGTLTASSLAASGSASSLGKGNISISGSGTLAYSGGTVSGVNRAITIGTGGGTLQTTNASATTLGLTGGINLGSNAFTINVGGNSASVINVSGAGITGSGSIIKSDVGLLDLAVANPSYTGNINITAGTLALTGNGSISNGSVANNSIFDISNTTSGGVIGSMSGAGNVLLGSQTLTINAGAGNNYTGIISGIGGGFTLGGGAMTLSGVNTYSGGTNINSGTLTISNNSAMGTGLATVASGALLVLNGVTLQNNLSVAGTGISNSGAFATAGSSTLNGNITLTGDALFKANNSDSLTINGAIDGGNALTISAGGNVDLQSSNIGVSTKLASLTVNTTGTLDLHNVYTTGAQSYTGSAITAHSIYSSDTGDIDFNTPLTLLSDTTISATVGNIYLNKVDGAFALDMLAGTAIYINNAIGSSAALTSLTTTGATQVGANITTSGAQTYNTAVTLTNNVAMAMTGSNNLTIVDGVSGAFDLNLVGGSDNTFTLAGALDVNNINVNGGTGSNTLYLNNNQNQTWTITGTDTGTVTGLAELSGTLTFSDIQHWQSGSGINTLVGANTANTWMITDTNAGTVTGLSNGFSNFNNLIGGSNTDNFTLNGGTLAGSIAGGAGTNSLTGDSIANTWAITGADSGIVTGVSGGFSNIQNLIGGSSTDNFTLNGGTLSGSIAGGSGNDSLTADNVVNTWNISAANTGTVTGVAGGFSSIETITGGSNNDTFTFGASGSIANLNGGGGSNVLDYSNYGSAVSFTIGGAATGITTSNSGLTQVVGSTIGNGTITAANVANTWNITSDNAGTVTGLSAGFSQFNNLVGGSNNDTFTFTNGKKITGTINGGLGGVNTLNFSSYTTAVAAILTNSSATGFTGTTSGTPNPTGGFSNITGLNLSSVGTTTATSITGRNVNSSWNITGSNAGTYTDGTGTLAFTGTPTLVGGSADDNFIFSDGMGVTGRIVGNAGTNAYNYSAYTTNVFMNLTNNTATGVGVVVANVSSVIGGSGIANTLTGGANTNNWNITSSNAGNITSISPTVTFSAFANLVGGLGADNFIFANGAGVTGSINGGAIVNSIKNTLNYSAYNTSVNINAATGIAPNITGGFSNITGFTGGSAVNTIVGPNTSNTWNITSNNSGNINGAITFSQFANLTGGSSDDSFVFSNGTNSISGIINGGLGSNSLNYSIYNNTNTVTINLLTNSATRTGGISNITNFIGGAAVNTIISNNSDHAWNITSSNMGNIDGTYTFNKFANLTGGSGSDTFIFSNNAAVTGVINGSAGTNTLNFSAYDSSSSVSIDLSNNTGTGLASFSNIQSIIGSNTITNSTLIGTNSASTWNITGNNAGTVGSMSFSKFGNLTGGSSNDTYVFSDGMNVSGLINGGNGINTLNYSAYTSQVNVNVGNLTSINNIIGSTALASSNTLTGPSGTNTWTLTGSNAGTVNSTTFSNFGHWVGLGGSTNTLSAMNVNNEWNITGNNAGNLNNSIVFSGFENLKGGSANDSFIFTDGASISGLAIGGAGTNTMDYSAYTAAVSVNLASNTATGVGHFNGVTNFVGGSGSNTMRGADLASNWNIADSSSGSIATSTGTVINYNDFDNLIGGISQDTFTFNNNAAVNSIDGGAGVNTYDYSASSNTNPITVNLANGSLINISNFVGPTNITGENTIIGPNTLNTWLITGNNKGNINNNAIAFTNFGNLTGGSNDDTFKFGTFSIAVSGIITGGGGVNTLNYGIYSNASPVTINLAANTATATGGISGINQFIGGAAVNTFVGANSANTWNLTGANAGNINGTISFTNFANLTGGSAADTFAINNGASISGVVNGSAGVNTLNYNAYTAPVVVNLATNSATGITQPFNNITNFVGTSSPIDATLIGNNTANTWTISNNNAGNLNSGSITFSQFGNLTGGVNDDTFVFTDGKGVTGVINGGIGGANILDLTSYTTLVNFTLGNATGSGFSGSSAGDMNPTGGFIGINKIINGVSSSLTGNDNNIRWTLSSASSGMISDGGSQLIFSGFDTLIGGAGENRLFALDTNNIWNITGNNTGNINNAVHFSGISNLIGGGANDTFIFSDGAGVSGFIDGKGGDNVFNYSAYTTPTQVDLANQTSTGVGLFFRYITNFMGGSDLNTLTGTNNNNVWNITGTDSGTITLFGTTITFSQFANLNGGSGLDTFMFTNTGNISGSIDGKLGKNTFNYTNYTNPVTIDLAQNAMPGVTLNSVANITAYVANLSTSNTLIGPNTNTTWNITGTNSGNLNNLISYEGFQNLTGGTGNDLFVFSNADGVDGSIDGGAGYNEFNFSAYLTPVIVNLTNQTATGTGGFDQVQAFTGSQVTIDP